jgi:hypothetical protein
VLGEPSGVATITLSLDGLQVPPDRILAGAGPWRGGPVPAAALETAAWPPGAALGKAERAGSGPAPVLALWRPAEPPPAAADDEAAEESARRLRALGYIE